ncbi:uncharacterized protein LOC106871521 [Octopus bimaculoides]|uniref:uncharacterized protein LOC106871521 n=1 Tax=Octopus bimaculoides TaxID=37653 RepID=UPI0022E2BAA6|nr:uncharacterized protein LOC106871521 [Octopus bimaculoides]
MSKSDSSSVTKNKLTPGAGHRDDRATTPGTDDESTVGPICENFAPQTWRKTICRNCFHAKSEHGLDTRTNGTENLANSADARKTTSKKEEEKEKSSDKNVSSTTDKSKNTAQTAPEATVKEEETKNTKPLAALLESNKPKKSPHVIPNATPVSLIMSNLANSKKPSPVDVKKCGPPGNTLLSTASAKKLVEKFGGSKTAPPSPSGPGPNKLPTFGKKTNSFLKETSKTDAPSPGTKQVTSAEASAKSSKTSDVVSTSAGTTSTPSSSLSSTSSSQSTSKTTSAASSKDTTTTKDSTIDTKKGSSDSSSTATTRQRRQLLPKPQRVTHQRQRLQQRLTLPQQARCHLPPQRPARGR